MKRKSTGHPGIYRVGKKEMLYVGDKSVGSIRMQDALKLQSELREQRRRNRFDLMMEQERITFEELLSLYCADPTSKRYITTKKQTYLDYFGELKVCQIRRNDLFKFRDKIKATPKQKGGGEITNAHVNRVLAGLRKLFNYAEARELIENTRNPFPKDPKSGLLFPEKKGKRNFFTEKQMIDIYNASPPWLKPIVAVSFYTGMRMGEIIGLRWEHVDLDAGIINLPNTKTLKDETGTGQTIVMQQALIAEIRVIPKVSEWVFVQTNGLPCKHWLIFKAFRRVLRSLGIDVKKYSFKEIRHTTATLLHLKGADTMAIRDQLRHTSSQTTESFYIGSDIEYQREQIERLTLNQKAEA